MNFPAERLRRLFFAGLGLVFVCAFGSLLVQVDGLIGSRGILPVRECLRAQLASVEGGPFEHAFAHGLPTFSWLEPSDAMLRAQCGAGVALGALLVLGVAPLFLTPCCWLLYLSLVNVGELFLSYQWDALLLEVALLACFFAPAGLRPWRDRAAPPAPPTRAALWALRLLLFRFMFSSGAVKLLSGDPTWADQSALTYHYFTQPLPTIVGWFVHQLPRGFHVWSCRAMFFVELVLPFGLFAGRIGRRLFAVATAALMVAIGVTGNYGFFEPLTVVLCLPTLADDPRFEPFAAPESARASLRFGLRSAGSLAATTLALVGMLLTAHRFSHARFGPEWLRVRERVVSDALDRSEVWQTTRTALEPWASVNTYGLFAVMTTARPSLDVQGSDDQIEWRSYGFRFKEGDLAAPPRWCAPHMPRLDWQLWFAALDRAAPDWLERFALRLLQGEPSVTALLGSNPFPDAPPRFVRIVRWEYEFTTREERRATGHWWKRRETGLLLPPTSLR